jgi:hypothetical protein
MSRAEPSDLEALASLKLLMYAGPDINAQDNRKDAPLHQVSEK